ncbi:polyhydroxyalkanoic acid system family protein [Arenibaculum pallidiluteum]|uniref:polyhydroxyalkanoic acid system family protein n=1 Tax=Arenibaculum pallidiluteum TaxID=2812559 RepID=UPI001A9578D6|nr:polyhydroxyalkanoic acid system family protein [Arenibaculum pallidiluteum]
MRKPVVVDVPHQLTRQDARTKIEDGLGQVRGQLAGLGAQVEDRWTGDRLDFTVRLLGQAVTGRMEVLDQSVRVEVDLPWILARLAGKVTDRIQKQGSLMLTKG